MEPPAARRKPWPEIAVLVCAAPFIGLGAALGIVELYGWLVLGALNDWWGIDGRMLVDAAERLLAGADIYADPIFLYPPAGALLAVPLAILPGSGLVLAWLKLGLVAIAAGLAARRLGAMAIALVVATSITTLPTVRDVILGNVNIFLTIAIAGVVAAPRSRTAAIVLGLLVAAFAKPMLAPLVLWVLVWRRITAPWLVGAAGLLTIMAAVLAGPGSYLRWLDSLLSGVRFASPSAWNVGLTALSPVAYAAGSVVAIGLLVLVLARGTAGLGLRVATIAGLVVAPYVGIAHLVLLLVPGWASMTTIPDGQRSARRIDGPRRQSRLR